MAFSQLKIFFCWKKIWAVSGNKESQKANTPTRPRWWIHHRNLWIPVPTPHLRKKNTTEKISSIKAVYFTVWEIKNIQNFQKKKTKKNKPKGRFVCFVLGRIKKQVSEWMNLMKLKSGFKGGNPVTPLKTHIRRLKNPSPFHQRSAFFGLCRKPGHHVCVCVKPSSHRVLPHLQVMPGWGWTCPSQGGDLLGL